MKTKGQEEMVGFALIVIIVGVILLVFIGFSIRDTDQEPIGSYELENFVLSMLHYNIEYNEDINDLIKNCNKYNEDCDVLESELNNILEKTWIVENGSVIKGYDLKITDKDKEILNIEKGDVTSNYKETSQILSAEVRFIVYY